MASPPSTSFTVGAGDNNEISIVTWDEENFVNEARPSPAPPTKSRKKLVAMMIGIAGVLLMAGLLGGLLAPSRKDGDVPIADASGASVGAQGTGVLSDTSGEEQDEETPSTEEDEYILDSDIQDDEQVQDDEYEDETTSTAEPLPIDYEHVIGRVDSQATCPSTEDSLPLLVAVTNRELIIGCRSFEEYLSPKYETIFILNKEVVKVWAIDKLVESATCEQTLGAHVFMLDNYGGEWLGRRVAVDFMLREMTDRRGNVEFLNQMNCDSRAIPDTHINYRPIEHMVEKLFNDFMVARAQREPERHPEIHLPDFPLVVDKDEDSQWLQFGILAMAPLLFEDFYDMSVLPEKVHGVDECNWREKGGLAGRPDRFDDYPWLCDVHGFTENHWLMFDMEKLTSPAVKAQYLDAGVVAGVHSFSSDTRLTPRVAEQHNLTTVLNLDVHGHQNFCHNSDCIDDIPVDKDWLRVTSMAHIAEQRNPSYIYQAWNGLHDHVIEFPRMGLTLLNFVRRHEKFDAPWHPEGLTGQALDSCELCAQYVDALFKCLGYPFSKEGEKFLHYTLEGVFPSNIYVHVARSDDYEAPNDTWEFLQVVTPDGDKYRYIAMGFFPTIQMRTLSSEERHVFVPKDGVIHALIRPSEIKNREFIHKRGHYLSSRQVKCGAPDQEELEACGYLESPDFE